MLHTILQVWGGLFYLLNKVCLPFAEATNGERQRTWRIRSWVTYLIGLPPWVIIFIKEHNYIAAALEAGGVPAMVLGLIIALRGRGSEPRWVDYLTVAATGVGLGYSWYYFGSLTTLNQGLELGIVTGFLVGTYLLAKERAQGYLWFMLMNASNAWLMAREHYPWLMWQQVASLAPTTIAYVIWKRKGG